MRGCSHALADQSGQDGKEIGESKSLRRWGAGAIGVSTEEGHFGAESDKGNFFFAHWLVGMRCRVLGLLMLVEKRLNDGHWVKQDVGENICAMCCWGICLFFLSFFPSYFHSFFLGTFLPVHPSHFSIALPTLFCNTLLGFSIVSTGVIGSGCSNMLIFKCFIYYCT